EVVDLLAVDPPGEAHDHRVERLSALQPVFREGPGVVAPVDEGSGGIRGRPRRRGGGPGDRAGLRLAWRLGEIVVLLVRRGDGLAGRPGRRGAQAGQSGE